MDPDIRPPPRILILHNGHDLHAHIEHLKTAGLNVIEAHLDGNPVEAVLSADPDLIVLDFQIDGDTVEQLKDDARTKHIPVIALAELVQLPADPGLESDSSGR